MKLFIFALIVAVCTVTALEPNDNSHSAQIIRQILCYLQRFKTTIPKIAIPLDEQMMDDLKSEQYNINHFNPQGVRDNLVDAHNLLRIALTMLEIFDPQHVALCEDIIAKLKPVIAKYVSGKGVFIDAFNLNVYIRHRLNDVFGGGCGESTLPDSESIIDDPLARIKNDLGKLKALAPEANKHFYDVLIRITDSIKKASGDYDVPKLIKDLEEYVKTQEALISKMPPTDARQHQETIKKSVENLIKKLKAGKGTFIDVYTDYYKLAAQQLALDV